MLALVGVILGGAALTLAAQRAGEGAKPKAPAAENATPARSATPFPVTIHKPAGAARVETSKRDVTGNPVTIVCGSCHTTTTPRAETRTASKLKEFHQGLTYTHGNLTCLSCHNSADYDTLRRADGSALHFTEVMQLCGQCHGTQHRDYQHGAHGGMLGYWDLTRGPRWRNNCIDCHDPHAPAYPVVMPVFPPRDRAPLKAHDAPTSHE